MINLDTKKDHIFDFYLDGSFCEREYFMGNLIRMRLVKSYYTSVTRVVHGVSVIAIKDYRKEMPNYNKEDRLIRY